MRYGSPGELLERREGRWGTPGLSTVREAVRTASGHRVSRPAGARRGTPSPQACALRVAAARGHRLHRRGQHGAGWQLDGQHRWRRQVGARPPQSTPAAPGEAVGPGTTGEAASAPAGAGAPLPFRKRACGPAQAREAAGDTGHRLSAWDAGALATRAAQRGPRAGGGRRPRALTVTAARTQRCRHWGKRASLPARQRPETSTPCPERC